MGAIACGPLAVINAGQTCVSANRILVQDGIHDAFTARLGAAIAALKVGDGLAASTTIGPLINAAPTNPALCLRSCPIPSQTTSDVGDQIKRYRHYDAVVGQPRSGDGGLLSRSPA
jgi:hypothetical protein